MTIPSKGFLRRWILIFLSGFLVISKITKWDPSTNFVLLKQTEKTYIFQQQYNQTSSGGGSKLTNNGKTTTTPSNHAHRNNKNNHNNSASVKKFQNIQNNSKLLLLNNQSLRHSASNVVDGSRNHANNKNSTKPLKTTEDALFRQSLLRPTKNLTRIIRNSNNSSSERQPQQQQQQQQTKTQEPNYRQQIQQNDSTLAPALENVEESDRNRTSKSRTNLFCDAAVCDPVVLTNYASDALVQNHLNKKRILSRLALMSDNDPKIPRYLLPFSTTDDLTLLSSSPLSSSSSTAFPSPLSDKQIAKKKNYYAVCQFMDFTYYNHFPHTMQQFYRCWSFWRIFPDKIPVFVRHKNDRYWKTVLDYSFTRGIWNVLPQLGIRTVTPNELISESELSSSFVSTANVTTTTTATTSHHSAHDNNNLTTAAISNNDVQSHNNLRRKTNHRLPTIKSNIRHSSLSSSSLDQTSISVYLAAPLIHPSHNHYQATSIDDMHSLRDALLRVISSNMDNTTNNNNNANANASTTTITTTTTSTAINMDKTLSSLLPSSTSTSSSPRIVIINRKKNRRLGNANEIINDLIVHFQLEKVPPKEVYFEQATFQEQIDIFANHDIIITPHGAQETGILFMPKNCGGILEILPFQYYYPKFFGTLAATCGIEHAYLYMGPSTTTSTSTSSTSTSSLSMTDSNNYKNYSTTTTTTTLHEYEEEDYYDYNLSMRDVTTMCPPVVRVREAVGVLIQRWQECHERIVAVAAANNNNNGNV